MSDEKLDELSKALATTTSRRQMLKVLAATAAGGVLTFVGAREAGAARCRRVGQPCRANFECCDFFCPPDTGRCACRPGENLCSKTRRCIRCDPEATFDPERASASVRRGRRSAAPSAARGRGVLPRRLLRPDVLPTGRDLLPGRLLLVLRGQC